VRRGPSASRYTHGCPARMRCAMSAGSRTVLRRTRGAISRTLRTMAALYGASSRDLQANASEVSLDITVRAALCPRHSMTTERAALATLEPVRFGEFLRDREMITDEQWLAALADHWSAERRTRIGSTIVAHGV